MGSFFEAARSHRRVVWPRLARLAGEAEVGMGSFFRGRGGVTEGRYGFVWRGSRARLRSEWVRFFDPAGASPGGGMASVGPPRGRGCGLSGFVFSRRRGRRRAAARFCVRRLGGGVVVVMGSFFRGGGGAAGGGMASFRAARARLKSEWVRFFEAAEASPGGG